MIWSYFQNDTQWGIFDSNGNAVGDPSLIKGIGGTVLEALGISSVLSTASIEYSKENRTADFPVEGGKFANYNKVELPAEPRVVLVLSGSDSERKSFLDAIDTASKSTDLYSVVTPEVTYTNYSLDSYNYSRRADHGATLLIVEIRLREVRQVLAAYTNSTVNTSNASSDSAKPQSDTGNVQSSTPSTSVLKSITNKLGIS